MDTVRDRLWLWSHQAGSYNHSWGLPSTSQVTPAEAAQAMGIPNLVMVVYHDQPRPPFQPYAQPLSSLRQVVWSVIGDGGSSRNDEQSDLDHVLALARECPNIRGGIMDDFFCGWEQREQVSRAGLETLSAFRTALHAALPPLDLWVVVYRHDLDAPITPYLERCDVVTLWTWEPAYLHDLDVNVARLEAMLPGKRKMLGCYLWDFFEEKALPIELLQHQCATGLRMMREGRIDGMIFCASCLCDMDLETVEWTRCWIAEVGAQPL